MVVDVVADPGDLTWPPERHPQEDVGSLVVRKVKVNIRERVTELIQEAGKGDAVVNRIHVADAE